MCILRLREVEKSQGETTYAHAGPRRKRCRAETENNLMRFSADARKWVPQKMLGTSQQVQRENQTCYSDVKRAEYKTQRSPVFL